MKIIKIEACKYCYECLIDTDGNMECEKLFKCVGNNKTRNDFIHPDCPLEDYVKTEWKPISEMKQNIVYWMADNDNNIGVGCLDGEIIKYNLAMTPEEFSKPVMFAEIKPPTI